MAKQQINNTSPGRIPPHSMEAEESVLGSLLIDKQAMIKVADLLTSEDFYQGKYAKIYQAMAELYEKSEPIDVVSLVNRLKEKKLLESVGGETAVTYLATVVPTAGNILHYARIVQKNATRRRLISAASDISEMSFEDDKEVDTLMDEAEQKLFSVSQGHKSQNFIRLASALEDAFIRIDKLHRGDQALRGVPTGFRSLDNRLAGFQKSDLIIVAARPSVGKTTLALDFARHAALAGSRVGIFSLEMSKEQLVDRMLAAHAHVDLWRLRTGKLNTQEDDEFDDFHRLGQAMSEMSQIPLYFDDRPSNNVMGMRTMARRLQSEHGLDLLIIDYLQLMESNRYTDNRVQEVSDISRSLKKLAIELDVPVIALSQLSRAVEMRTDQRPKLSDLRESGCLAGETRITRADTGEQISIRELAERQEQEPIPVFAMNEHYRQVVVPMTKVFHSGKKRVYVLQTRSGRTIRASANHPFKTIQGWQRLDKIAVGVRIGVPTRPTIHSLNDIPREPKRAGGFAWGQVFDRNGLSRQRMGRLATVLESTLLQELAESDVYWDEVMSVTEQGIEDVYDATVSGVHNFVANDMFVHNSIEQDADVVMFLHRQPFEEGVERPDVYDVDLLIEKHRNGPTGEVPLRFHAKYVTYAEIDQVHAEEDLAEAEQQVAAAS